MIIIVDRALCIGAANCVAIAPTVFELDDERKAVVIDPYGVGDELIKAAAQACPTKAIVLQDEATGETIYPS